MDLIEQKYSYTRIVHNFFVRNWKDEGASTKTAIARRAVSSYLADTEVQHNVDPVFKQPDEDRVDDVAKTWAHQIDKFFSPSESVKLPYSFGDHLVMALDDEYRKACLAEIDRKRKSVLKRTSPDEGDIVAAVQLSVKETSEAISHLIGVSPEGLEDDSDQALLRARQETLEAIDALQQNVALLDQELAQRGIELL